METSLTKTLAKKFKNTCRQIYRRFGTFHQNEYGTYKVIEVSIDTDKKPLVARFGGVPLRWNKWAAINDAPTEPIWSKRSELLERLLAQECELCGSKDSIEVHHIRKLANLEQKGQSNAPKWVKMMAQRHRKTLVICQKCHHDIHYGRYDGEAITK